MTWKTVTTEADVQDLLNTDQYSLIYKHSPRCMTSLMAFRNMKSGSESDYSIPFHIVDVIQNREVSGLIAKTFAVKHESPQVLIVKNGACVFDISHEDIVLRDIVKKINHLNEA
ncbi:bacillithiol system redox-active protein YtxJ [Dyadobacter sp. LHD-138]|uniref:bacillithiol system redox-active protein YtxJ n=1 Tax=Dyadobacter sp. LHD-138 TaxID=3071413 RepID=UPI0027E01F1B|nr:bacillithiol system redox-active protein YtxJ [Dyadobacter sp. LHD-138]MDQ6479156.1 bacillithiol system redox-active protein YtxJ [Dyadobacter sp. LHD-138]